GVDLPAAELLGEQDCRLFPPGRRCDDDRVDPLGRLEPLEALREQRPIAEADERLRPVCAEPLATACRGENGPHAHRALAVALFFAAGFFAAVALFELVLFFAPPLEPF